MNIFLLELRNQRRSAFVSTLAIGGVILAMLSFFPAMQTRAMQELAGAKMEGIDPALLAALGLSTMVDFTIIGNFFGYVLQYITLAIMVVITQRAAALFIKEETDGTIEYLCAKPVSRNQIFFEKLLAHTVLLLGALIVFFALTVAGYLMFGDITAREALRETAIYYSAIFFVGLVFSAAGVLLSTVLKSGRGTAGVTIAIVFGSFLLGMMSVVIDQLEFFIWFSPMDWIKPSKLMNQGIVPGEWITGLVVILGCTLAAWSRYRTKDLLI